MTIECIGKVLTVEKSIFSSVVANVGKDGMCSGKALLRYIGRIQIRYALRKKLRDYLGIFPIGGGRVFPIPKTFVN